MQIRTLPDRRRFLRLAAGFATGALLSGCGGGGSTGADGAVAVVPGATPSAATPTAPVAGSHPLNLALNLAYLGAAFYGYAARGTGLSSASTEGVGRAGLATGARAATFSDPAIAAYAAELADDKQAHVADLRRHIGALAAAQPSIDLSTTATGGFALAAQQAGIVAAGATFDPYASDNGFLLAALLVESVVAAAHRTMLAGSDGAGAALVAGHLADAIYHGGLIRSLLESRAATDPTLANAFGRAATLLTTLDGTAAETLPATSGLGANILDVEGRPIPFTRETAQVLRVLYLGRDGAGGFLPGGANGIA